MTPSGDGATELKQLQPQLAHMVQRLERIQYSLSHQRRFGFDTVTNWRAVACRAEGDINELLTFVRSKRHAR